MSNPVRVSDLEARWRILSDAETITAEAVLDDAWALLKSKIPGLDEAASGDVDLSANVVRVESQMVLRVLKNPDGIKTTTVSIDDASRTITRDGNTSTGLYVTDEELGSLSAEGEAGAFTIRPTAKPFYGPTSQSGWYAVSSV